MDALDPRTTQGVLLGAIGRGGDPFDGFRSADVPLFRTTDLTAMATPALVVAGDKDDSRHWTTTGPDWHAELTAAHLRTAFHPGDPSWRTAQDALTTGPDAFGRVCSKA
ncbi:hypothetical protein GCM10010371_32830 [Streptomyces subrutilus]|uniref:Alpha/beta hydrolase n=1 Tax=Streptomyces subrutilus TaxID=36818 RepID=A0A5P2V009_9ACTN|nr:hypothetical protein [Streptomyces subrutilus]QEU82367.1 hypothetical protein CP968_32550 [Streptomyces subrutilus]GGZ70377.1 hypothetical protein GCM10010371_32830 [Streptomyces subrutilus]